MWPGLDLSHRYLACLKRVQPLRVIAKDLFNSFAWQILTTPHRSDQLFVAVIRKLFRVAVPIGFPIESLKHDTVVFEAGLGQRRRCAGENRKENNGGGKTPSLKSDGANCEP